MIEREKKKNLKKFHYYRRKLKFPQPEKHVHCSGRTDPQIKKTPVHCLLQILFIYLFFPSPGGRGYATYSHSRSFLRKLTPSSFLFLPPPSSLDSKKRATRFELVFNTRQSRTYTFPGMKKNLRQFICPLKSKEKRRKKKQEEFRNSS